MGLFIKWKFYLKRVCSSLPCVSLPECHCGVHKDPRHCMSIFKSCWKFSSPGCIRSSCWEVICSVLNRALQFIKMDVERPILTINRNNYSVVRKLWMQIGLNTFGSVWNAFEREKLLLAFCKRSCLSLFLYKYEQLCTFPFHPYWMSGASGTSTTSSSQ